MLEKDGSYPSGHSAVGWAWALILSEISPAQTDAILARGRVFGESRNVCNVHWHSDVVQGRSMGASTVARLHCQGFRIAVARGLGWTLLRLTCGQPDFESVVDSITGKRRSRGTSFRFRSKLEKPDLQPATLVIRTPYDWRNSTRPFKNIPTPIAETKKPVMRDAASIPFGPIFFRIGPA